MSLTKGAQELVAALHRIGAFRFGDFVLKDGRHSPFYVDLRSLISHPQVLAQSARELLAASAHLRYDRIAGIPYAGLPLGVAMSLEGNRPLVYPRKEIKDYGTRKRVEGAYDQGDRALVVDDVITSGGAKIEAVQPLRAAGLVVEDVLVVVDRQQGAEALLAANGLQLHRVVRIEEALACLEDSGRISASEAARSREFLQQP